MPDRSGQQFGNYRLVHLLGQGGFADVYLGEHMYLETQAAIKVLHVQIGRSEQESFRQEAKTLAHLVHTRIVRVLEFGIEERTPFLVMDYAVNGTLRQQYPKGSILPLPTIVSYVQQVAEALHYAHEKRLIHRDVKPENILLGASRQVLLSDFGLATLAQNSSLLITREKIGAGTAAYTAPEQIRGKPRTASDQYSLGVVVYEWLTGARPFQGSPLELYYQHLHVAPTALQERVPEISPLIEQVVLTALAKEPTERFASVQAFATALAQTMQVNQASPLTPPTSAVLIQFGEQEQRPVLEQPDIVPPAPIHVSREPLSTLLPTRPPSTEPPSASQSIPSTPGELITQPSKEPISLEGEIARGVLIPGNKNKKISASRRASRSKVVPLSVLVVLVVLALGGGLIWLRLPHVPVIGSTPIPTRTITPSGSITEFRLPISGSIPFGITAGPDGSLWFTELIGNQIGRITPSGSITEFRLPISGSGPNKITAGPDGNLWFTEYDGNQIGRITPRGTITEFRLPTSGSRPSGITAGPDGNLWFTEQLGNQIGRITPNGTITEFRLPTSGSRLYGITGGPDGNLWFIEREGNQIGRITPSGTITEFPIPTSASGPEEITARPDGNLWFTEEDGNQIGRITLSGSITEFRLPTSGSHPYGITAGPDSNLWFTELIGNQIGRITPSGTITEFRLPTSGSFPDRITAGPDGNLWFTERYGNQIGRITTGK